MIRLALCLLLAACGSPAPPPVVPTALRVCPDKAIAPPALPAIVTADRLNAAHRAERQARQADEASIADCRARLEQLNAWIDDHPPAH